MSPLYRASPTDMLIVHPLDSMTLIFQKSSGITHMVADPVPALLAVMAARTMSGADIAAALSDQYDLEEGAAVADIVLARLEELCALGLVERVAQA